jgi:hypothetical protein
MYSRFIKVIYNLNRIRLFSKLATLKVGNNRLFASFSTFKTH